MPNLHQLLKAMTGPMSGVLGVNVPVAKVATTSLAKAAAYLVQNCNAQPRPELASADAMLAQPFHKLVKSLQQYELIKSSV